MEEIPKRAQTFEPPASQKEVSVIKDQNNSEDGLENFENHWIDEYPPNYEKIELKIKKFPLFAFNSQEVKEK